MHLRLTLYQEDVDGWAKPNHDECDGWVFLIEHRY
jgi:hypothetical protein